MQTPARENAEHLRRRFAERLLALRPSSVLDVGCGEGGVLSRLLDAGVRAVGLDPAGAPHGGLPIVRAAAAALPFADGSFDWVAMRHVAHHLEDPRSAFAEAARVARTGLFLAEPWRPEGLPGQEAGLRLDRWLKARDRERGEAHDEDLSPAEIVRLLPEGRSFEVEVECYLRERAEDPADLAARVAKRLAGLAPDAPERDAARSLLGGDPVASVTGTALVIARARSHPRSVPPAGTTRA